MRFLLLLLALLPVAAVAQIETPGTGGGGSVGVGTSTPYYGPFTNTQIYGVNTNALRINSGVITSSLPAIDISQTWSNSGVTFTGLKLNVVNSNSASSSLLADLQVGSSSTFSIRRDGSLILANVLRLLIGNTCALMGQNGTTKSAEWNNTAFYASQKLGLGVLDDVFILRESAGTVQFGDDAATATAQTIKAHDGSGTDKDGASLTLAGGKNTGGGLGGALITQTSLPGSGSGQGSLGTRHYAYAGQKALTDSVTGDLFDVSIPTSKYASVRVFVSIKANDGFGGWSVNTIEKNFSAYNDAGTVVVGASADTTSVAHAAVGTETVGVSGVSTGGNMLRIQAVFISDGWAEVPSSIVVRWQIWINSDDIATVTPL